MPTSAFHLARLLVASGLFMLATFASAKAQETPLDPNLQDIPLPEAQTTGFEPVTQLAVPENDYPNCAPAPGAWHPPIFHPDPTLCCPTGVVHRDWWREKTLGFHVNRRQRMLAKDYQWRIQYAHQSVCCPPHSCWGHSCDTCPGIGCHKERGFLNCLSRCGDGRCAGCANCAPCGAACGSQPEGTGIPAEPDLSSAVDAETPDILSAGDFDVFGVEPTSAIEAEMPNLLLASHWEQEGELLTSHWEQEGEAGKFLLISDERLAGPTDSGVESAGFFQISDGCAQGNCDHYHSPGWGHGFQGGHGYHGGHGFPCPLHHGFGHGHGSWDDCEMDGPACDCPICLLKWRCGLPFKHLCDCLYSDGIGRGNGGYGGNGGGRDRGTRRGGRYHIAYPVNPYHFDQRDGRIYAAQGYGHPVGVPLAPNVEHTYNYGWGVPSSRLSPVSRMPGAPGVANPAVPGAAGPGVFPPAFPSPMPAGLMNLPR